jgi:hypothetical protein
MVRSRIPALVRLSAFAMAVGGACAAVEAASPVLETVLPRGGQRGTDVQVTLSGDRLADAQELFLYNPGLTVKKLEVVGPKQVKVVFAIAADAALGEHALRVRTATGVSALRTFWVGALPVVQEKEPNNDLAKPQPIKLNTTVEGTITNEDVDYFVVDAKKGQRVTAEVEGIRLGGSMFDPYVAFWKTDRSEVASCDDSPLLLQDPVASFVAPEDGAYVVEIRDGSYGGNGNSRYRLHVGTFPRPRMVYPAGGKAGEELAADFVGDVAGPIHQALRLPDAPSDEYRVLAEQGGQTAPSANHVRVSTFANVLEAEPNNDAKTATPAAAPTTAPTATTPASATTAATTTAQPPVAFNGVIGTKGDADWFRFTARKDQALDVHVYARQLRSPLDSVLSVHDAAGKSLANNDDTGGPDSYVRFQVPADGDYLLRVTDHLGNGGPDYVYRVEVVPVQPKLALTVPLVAPNSQERQAVVVPRGNRFATLVRATRSDFGGALKVAAGELPPGVACADAAMPDGVDTVPLVFEAAADAPTGGRLCQLTAAPEDAGKKIPSTFTQTADLVVFGNQTAYYQAKTDRLAVAVADEAPFKINIVPPKVPLVQSGSMQLKVVAERKAGFTAPIKLTMPFRPPGVGAGDVTIPENGSEITLPLNASGDARVDHWKVCVLGSAESNGPVWVSTQLAELEVGPPLLAGKIEMAAGERGKPVQVLCKLEQKRPFEGKAKVELLGLPPNTSAEPKEITSADTEVVFDVQTGEKSPTGQHKSLFCAVTVTQDGEPVRQSIAGGGVLRIDAPSAAPAAKPAVAAAAAPTDTQKPAKPLSRLEKLRLDRAGSQ